MIVGQIFHLGHSSVTLTESGLFFEIRRGFLRFTDIPIPNSWTSIDQWAYAVLHQIDFDIYHRTIPASWTPDQIFAQQWFEFSNIHLLTVPQEHLDQIQESIETLQTELNTCLQLSDYPIEHRNCLLHSIRFLKNEYYDCININSKGGEYKIHMDAVSPILVKSAYTLIPLYMNLETGIMGIAGSTLESCKGVFGSTFADLGLAVTEVYRLEFGQYIRVI